MVVFFITAESTFFASQELQHHQQLKIFIASVLSLSIYDGRNALRFSLVLNNMSVKE